MNMSKPPPLESPLSNTTALASPGMNPIAAASKHIPHSDTAAEPSRLGADAKSRHVAAEQARIAAEEDAQRIAAAQARFAALAEAQRLANEKARLVAQAAVQHIATEQARLAELAEAKRQAEQLRLEVQLQKTGGLRSSASGRAST